MLHILGKNFSGKPALEDLHRPAAHPGQGLRLVHQPGDTAGQSCAVPVGEDQAVLPVVNEPGVSAVAADDGGQAHAHPLQDRQAGGLSAVGGVELHVQHREHRGHIGLEAQEEHCVLQPPAGHLPAQFLLISAHAGNEDLELPPLLLQLLSRLHNMQVALVGLDAGQDSCGKHVRTEAVLRPKVPTHLRGAARHRGHPVHHHGDALGGDAGVGEVGRRRRAHGDDPVGVVLVHPLIHPPPRGIPQLGGHREGGMAGIHHLFPAPPGGDAAGQGPVGMDDVRVHPGDELLEQLHVPLVIGAVGDAVHLIDGGVQFLQRGLQQASPGKGHRRVKLRPVGVLQIVDEHPSGAADVGIADDVQYTDH